MTAAHGGASGPSTRAGQAQHQIAPLKSYPVLAGLPGPWVHPHDGRGAHPNVR